MFAKPFVTPRELAQSLGVGESSIKRWADEGRIRVGRTFGGHRRIPTSEAVRFIRNSGLPMIDPQLLGLTGVASAGAATPTLGTEKDQADQFLASLKAGRAEEAQQLLLSEFFAGKSLARLADERISPALAAIGDIWKEDTRGIFIEHRAVDICLQAARVLQSLLPKPEPDAPAAVGGAPAGDPYALVSVLASGVLTEAGFSSHNIGPDTPLHVLELAAEPFRPRVTWVSMTVTLDNEAQEEWKRGLETLARQCAPWGGHVVVGGQGVPPSLCEAPSPNFHRFRNLRELSEFAQTLLQPTTGMNIVPDSLSRV